MGLLKCVFFAVVIFSCDVGAFAEEGEPKPFEALANATKDELVWLGNTKWLAPLFNRERVRLGKRFDAALIEFCGTSELRHLGCARFLVERELLQGQAPHPYLSQLLLEQGKLLASRNSRCLPEQRWCEEVEYRFPLAVGYQKLGMKTLAAEHKQWIESRRNDPVFSGPNGSDEDERIYDSIQIPKLRGDGTRSPE